jgi:hypothetical protein
LSRYKKALGYATAFSVVESSLKDFEFKRAWELRLRHQVRDLPAYERVIAEVIKKLKPLMKQ